MRKIFLLVSAGLAAFTPLVAAVTTTETKDTNGDGKTDVWTTRDDKGYATMVATDKHKKGMPTHWVYYKNGKEYKREWDRNFDGKADFRIYERDGRVMKKEYDDNFDGVFGKVEKPFTKGSDGRIKTMASQANKTF